MGSFVDDGMPASREDWPEGALEALDPFVQGDVIACPDLVFHGAPFAPITRTSRSYAEDFDSAMPVAVDPDDLPPWALVTSGTCDLAEQDARVPRKPFVQVSPIVDMSDINRGDQKLITENRFGYLLHVPLLSDIRSGLWVADLRIEYPVEKTWIAGQERLRGWATEREQQIVGKAVARQRQRPAMGRAFIDQVLKPLRKHLAEVRKNRRDLADRVDSETIEWAVQVDSRLDPKRLEIVLLSDRCTHSDDVQQWWRDTVDSLRAEASAGAAGLTITGPRFERLDELPVSEYRKLTPLDSPHDRFSNE
ncbi:hypothetical protein [Streptomyces pseudovenezuelae]|uniref:hypothetical protein n=1 Tax=Streptomyces pseudovenezuelae TaxID=67350 RepID=UPI002E81565D|nr:hypothetical protein [Streptomyces pseudovenezuelae]WUA89928.1 hypothetical protein OHO81_22640 [Streptomyces pseudovenezuelae]